MNYFGKVLEELKKIKFPAKREVLVVSGVVILSVFLFGILLYLMDLFSWFLIDKLIIGF